MGHFLQLFRVHTSAAVEPSSAETSCRTPSGRVKNGCVQSRWVFTVRIGGSKPYGQGFKVTMREFKVTLAGVQSHNEGVQIHNEGVQSHNEGVQSHSGRGAVPEPILSLFGSANGANMEAKCRSKSLRNRQNGIPEASRR